MKNLIIFGFFILVLVFAQFAQAQTVDDVINKHIAALGGKENLIKIQIIKIEFNLERIISMMMDGMSQEEAATYIPTATKKKRKDLKTILTETLTEYKEAKQRQKDYEARPKMLKYRFTIKNWYNELVNAMLDYENKYGVAPTCIFFQYPVWEKMKVIMARGNKKVETNPLRAYAPRIKKFKDFDDPPISFFENETGSIRLLLCIDDQLGKKQFGLIFQQFGQVYAN